MSTWVSNLSRASDQLKKTNFNTSRLGKKLIGFIIIILYRGNFIVPSTFFKIVTLPILHIIEKFILRLLLFWDSDGTMRFLIFASSFVRVSFKSQDKRILLYLIVRHFKNKTNCDRFLFKISKTWRKNKKLSAWKG